LRRHSRFTADLTVAYVGAVGKWVSVWRGYKTSGMAWEFVGCQCGQMSLMPPSLGEWLPEDHLVRTVLGAVEQMDLDRFAEA
jgi:hypothetical protein